VAFFQRCEQAGWPVVWWVKADSRLSVVASLNALGEEMGLFRPGDVTEEEGVARLLTRLRSDKEPRRLLVLDNVESLDDLAGCLPVEGSATVVLTTAHQEVSEQSPGDPIDVTTYTESQATGYLARNSGLDDSAGALAVAKAMEFLPLAITQAAAYIKDQSFRPYSYQAYLEELSQLPLSEALPALHDPLNYPGGTARAIVASLQSALTRSPDRAVTQAILDTLSLLDPAGVRVDRLSILGNDRTVNAALVALQKNYVITGSEDNQRVLLHGLVARMVRELNAGENRDDEAGEAAITVLAAITPLEREGFEDQRAEAAELANHLTALSDTQPPAADDPRVIRAAAHCGFALNELHRPDAASATLVPAVERATRVLGPDHPDTLLSRHNLAYAYESAGRVGEAIGLFEATLADRERVLGADHPATLRSRHNLAWARWHQGERAVAWRDMEEASVVARRVLSPDHEVARAIAASLAQMRAELGQDGP
jgi:tetratricopeptide (TPR) repeat protein